MLCGSERCPGASGRSSEERTAASDGARNARSRGKRLRLHLLVRDARKAGNPTPLDRSLDSSDELHDSSDVPTTSTLKRCRASVSFLVSTNRSKPNACLGLDSLVDLPGIVQPIAEKTTLSVQRRSMLWLFTPFPRVCLSQGQPLWKVKGPLHRGA